MREHYIHGNPTLWAGTQSAILPPGALNEWFSLGETDCMGMKALVRINRNMSALTPSYLSPNAHRIDIDFVAQDQASRGKGALVRAFV